jgi:hypothetical protein
MTMGEIEKSSNFLFYTTQDGKQNIQVLLDGKGETVWMTQKEMAAVFGVDRSVVTKHLKNIFTEEELQENSVCAFFAHTAEDGKTYRTKFYNLDAIISVGYRVNSKNATQFRIWATGVLKSYLIKGFSMDDDRLKQGNALFGKDYFDELLERIREIRTSERRFYQKVTDLYATSVDYNPKSPTTKTFYALVQNKLEFAITKMTAAEIIASRANSQKRNMGLTSWKDQPKGGKIAKSDVSIAKNYLSEKELDDLNFLVSMYLDYAESQARKNKFMAMDDWVQKLDAFLQFNEYDLLKGTGKVRSTIAKSIAEDHYSTFRNSQDENYVSDFDAFYLSLSGSLHN